MESEFNASREERFSFEEQRKLDERKFLEQFGSNLGGHKEEQIMLDNNLRSPTPIGNRAFSMPTLWSSEQPSSGSDKSTIDIEAIIRSPGETKNMPFMHPRSVPSSPEKKQSAISESEFEINLDRSKSQMTGRSSMEEPAKLHRLTEPHPHHKEGKKTASGSGSNQCRTSRRGSLNPACGSQR